MKKYRPLKEANISYSPSDADEMTSAITDLIIQLFKRKPSLNDRVDFLSRAIFQGIMHSAKGSPSKAYMNAYIMKLMQFLKKHSGDEGEEEVI